MNEERITQQYFNVYFFPKLLESKNANFVVDIVQVLVLIVLNPAFFYLSFRKTLDIIWFILR